MTAFYHKNMRPSQFLLSKIREYASNIVLVFIGVIVVGFFVDWETARFVALLTLAFTFGVELGRYGTAKEIEEKK